MPLIKSFFPKHVISFYSQKPVDFHFNKSTPRFTARQKNYLKKKTGLDLKKCYNIRQVHGNRVVVATKKTLNRLIQGADALVTKEKNLPIAVRTADCLSIFLYDPKTEVIGIVHAGWRSTKKRIAIKTVQAMRKKFGAKAKDIKAAFGPCLQACCFEADAKFKKWFPKETQKIRGRYYFDNAAANKNQLLKSGLKPRHIRGCKVCTLCDKKLYSYRRNGERAGRFISILVKK